MDVQDGLSAGSANLPGSPRRRAIAGLAWRGLGEGGVATAAVALAWALILAESARGAPEGLRSLVFAFAPFLLLAGLHARISGYLHSRQRLALLPRPITAGEHWRLALARHRRGFAWVVIFGVAAIVLGLGLGLGLGREIRGESAVAEAAELGLVLVGDLLWMLLLAALVEPLIAGLSAWLGRRFEEGSHAAEIQRTLASGWTAKEAAVHLYVPALGVALAVGLAMPGQLAVELRGPTRAALPFLALPLLVGLGLRLLAPRLYRVGLWEATPRIHEISRTLAGPPRPAAAPGWIARLPPAMRIELLQLLRLRSLLGARLVAVVGAVVWIAGAQAPSAASFAAGMIALSLWLGPFVALHRQQGRRRRLMGALPVGERSRRGAMSPGTLLLGGAPVLAVVLVALLR